jgi:hypothetical protein
MRVPAGLGTAGQKLWRAVDSVFDLQDEPHKTQILGQACKVADIIAELDEAADDAPLTVRGSQNQPVISPLIAEARVQRALLAQLLGRLGLPDNDEDDEAGELRARRSRAGRTAARARWNRGY